uniref:Uncharacterized protein n=1 Tax=Lactuca sativa TaxID=4236 RepID=A0A9R1UUD3_LACSA|nr:hypothetical protein LSAT_V11C800439680 [Lactuca sativa]
MYIITRLPIHSTSKPLFVFSGREVGNTMTTVTHHLRTSASADWTTETTMHLPPCDDIGKESHRSKHGFPLSESRAVVVIAVAINGGGAKDIERNSVG